LTRINVPTARKRDIGKMNATTGEGKKSAKYREEPWPGDLIGLVEIDSD
jgi:hypothetical protein